MAENDARPLRSLTKAELKALGNQLRECSLDLKRKVEDLQEKVWVGSEVTNRIREETKHLIGCTTGRTTAHRIAI